MKKTLALIMLISLIAMPFGSFAKDKKEKPSKEKPAKKEKPMSKKEMEAEIVNLNANADLQKSKISALESEKADLASRIVQLTKDNDQCKQDLAALGRKFEETAKPAEPSVVAEPQPEPEPVAAPTRAKGAKKSARAEAKAEAKAAKVVAGLAFKVQVGAYKNFNISGYFENPKTMSTEDLDGYKKYLIGYFDELKKAETFEKDMKKMGIKDAWIVPYKDGARISDQEAEQLLGHPLRKK